MTHPTDPTSRWVVCCQESRSHGLLYPLAIELLHDMESGTRTCPHAHWIEPWRPGVLQLVPIEPPAPEDLEEPYEPAPPRIRYGPGFDSTQRPA